MTAMDEMDLQREARRERRLALDGRERATGARVYVQDPRNSRGYLPRGGDEDEDYAIDLPRKPPPGWARAA